jgi:hypothetical protein
VYTGQKKIQENNFVLVYKNSFLVNIDLKNILKEIYQNKNLIFDKLADIIF